MTEIEKKALELVNEVSDGFHDVTSIYDIHTAKTLRSALCRAIEQHEAFRQEVSDAVEDLRREWPEVRSHIVKRLSTFIIAKPDPLVDIADQMKETYCPTNVAWARNIRQALAKRGLEIREKANG